MSRLLCSAVMLTGLATGLAHPVQAQFESLVSSVTDVSLNTTCTLAHGGFTDHKCPGKSSFGLEMIWRVREIAMDGAGKQDSVLKHTSRTRTTKPAVRGTGVDTTTTDTFAVVPSTDSTVKKWVILELALGYSEFASLRSRDASFELRGTARELPALSVYGSLEGYVPQVTPYIGLRSGVIDVQSLQAVDGVLLDTTTVYSAAPRAFQLGLLAGLAWTKTSIQPTIEVAYVFRDFPSLQWSSASRSSVPTRFPRELSLSGWTLTFGMQISLRDLKP
jgi:hypothetical protein